MLCSRCGGGAQICLLIQFLIWICILRASFWLCSATCPRRPRRKREACRGPPRRLYQNSAHAERLAASRRAGRKRHRCCITSDARANLILIPGSPPAAKPHERLSSFGGGQNKLAQFRFGSETQNSRRRPLACLLALEVARAEIDYSVRSRTPTNKHAKLAQAEAAAARPLFSARRLSILDFRDLLMSLDGSSSTASESEAPVLLLISRQPIL